MRPDSAWLGAGLACVGLALWVRSGTIPDGAIVDAIAVALREPGQGGMLAVIEAAVVAGLSVIASIAIVLVSAGLLAGAVLGRLGPVRPEVARQLGIAAVPQRLRVAIGGAVVLGGVMAFDLQRRIAGGARASDASVDGLQALWIGSATETLLAAGLGMIAVGAIEAWIVRRDQWVAVTPTPAQAAEEAKR